MSENQSKKRKLSNNSEQSQKSIGLMKPNNKYTKSKQDNYIPAPVYLMWPILFILCILPFINRLKVYDSHLTQYPWAASQTEYYDFFLYYKYLLFVVAAAVMAIIIIYKVIKQRNAYKIIKIFIPLGIYALFAFLSSVFSKNPAFSFSGGFEQFESIFAILGYCIAAFYVYYFVHAEKDFQLIFKTITIAALILSVIGVFQFIGLDYINSSFIRGLMLPDEYKNMEITMNFPKGTVFATLYNPNYVGVYAALIVPILLVMMIYIKEAKWKLLNGLAIIGLLICTIGAKSLAGIAAIGVAGLLIAIVMWRRLLKNYRIVLPIALGLLICVVVINFAMHNYFGDKVINTLKHSKSNFEVTQMDTNSDGVSLTYHGNQLKLQYVKNEDRTVSFYPMDSDNKLIQSTYNESINAYSITDPRFTGINFGLADEEGKTFCIQAAGHTWFFTNQTGDGQYYYVNVYGKTDKIINAPSAVFTGYEGIATGRGYIWSRTIPLLKNNILIGSGPDTFVLDFPQQDYFYRSLMNFDTALMTKPHSLYLQIAAQTGIISLLAFLAFYGMYFVTSIRLYILGRSESYYAKAGLAVFIGSFAYMVTGLTNDSCIAVAPTYWVLMGLGIALNAKAKPLIQQELAEYNETKRKSKKENI